MASIKVKSHKANRTTSPSPSREIRLSKVEVDQIRHIAEVRHGRALLRALIGYYDCSTTKSREDYFDKKLKGLFTEFDDMEKSEVAKRAAELIRDLSELYGIDGLRKELNIAFGRRG